MNRKAKRINHNLSGSFLIELVIAIAILIIVLIGYLQLFIYCFGQSETARNISIAITEVQGKLEEMRNHNFSDIVIDYGLGGNPGNTFSLTQLSGVGAIYINSTNPKLLTIELEASWRERGNRIIGEDVDLDGVLDTGEDSNGNGKLDSTVSLVSMITER